MGREGDGDGDAKETKQEAVRERLILLFVGIGFLFTPKSWPSITISGNNKA